MINPKEETQASWTWVQKLSNNFKKFSITKVVMSRYKKIWLHSDSHGSIIIRASSDLACGPKWCIFRRKFKTGLLKTGNDEMKLRWFACVHKEEPPSSGGEYLHPTIQVFSKCCPMLCSPPEVSSHCTTKLTADREENNVLPRKNVGLVSSLVGWALRLWLQQPYPRQRLSAFSMGWPNESSDVGQHWHLQNWGRLSFFSIVTIVVQIVQQ